MLFQPIAKQQVMIYSELGPTVTGKNNNIFVSGGDNRIEYAELDHRRARHVPPSDSATKVTTTCLTTPDHEAGNFGMLLDVYTSHDSSRLNPLWMHGVLHIYSLVSVLIVL